MFGHLAWMMLNMQAQLPQCREEVGCWGLEISLKLRIGQTYDMPLARDTEVVWHLELTGILEPAVYACIDMTAKKTRCVTITA